MLQRLARSALDLRGKFRSARHPTGNAAATTGATAPTQRTALASFVFTGVFALAAVTAVTAVALPSEALARTPQASVGGVASMSLAELPPEGQKTYGLIRSGGPFPFEKDGVVFGNRERLLPLQERGYYREYTVATPQARDRGARRIVCGGARRSPDRCYYTADHYSSFREIAP